MTSACRCFGIPSAKVLLFRHKKGDKLSPVVAFLSPRDFFYEL